MAASKENITVVHHRNVWGEWVFEFEAGKLCALYFVKEASNAAGHKKNLTASDVKACAETTAMPDSTLDRKTANAYKKAAAELNAYLGGKLREFTIPIKIKGTAFQAKVWEETRKIPYGETRTYKQIAEAVKSPKATRAVGGALHANPLQIVVPCHRVVGKKGDLVGYALGTGLKRRLLCMEGAMQNEFDLE